MIDKKLVLPIILIFTSLILSGLAVADINIGILGHRGSGETIKTWNSLSTYLNESLPGKKFRIIPLAFDEIEASVKNKNIDFLLVNPGIYVNMEVKYRISRLLTLNKRGKGKLLNQFGSVIFAKKTRQDLNSLSDIKGRTIIAVHEKSLGGYQMVWRELKKKNINMYASAKALSFTETHDAVVNAIKNDQGDFGIVRTGILEQMSQDGDININNYKVFNLQKTEDFPFLLSTALYPEWPFSKLHHTSNELAQKVAVALLQMKSIYSEELALNNYSGWTVPLDYEEVHKLFADLNLPPYEKKMTFTLKDALLKYFPWIIVVAIFLIVVVFFSLWVFHLYRRIREAKYNLEQEHELILNSVCDGIYGVDLEGNCTYINKATTLATGWKAEELIGKPQHQILHHTHADGTPHPDTDCPVYKTFKDSKSRFIEDDIFWKKDGSYFFVEYSATPVINKINKTIGSVVVFRDTTERKKLEDKNRKYSRQISHLSRLNTLGEMATGIAHELNQPLSAIATNAFASKQLIKSDNPDLEQHVYLMDKIEQHTERADKIIKHMRSISRNEVPKSSWVNSNHLIKNVLELLKNEIKRNEVTIEEQYDDSLPDIYCQLIQIDQVVLNLCKNAIESLRSNDAGNRLLKITTKNEKKSRKVIINIEDNGPGIKKELLPQLFQPFVTSKDKGMGLGLSICKNIVESHKGELYLLSSTQGKTCFVIELPISHT